MNIVFMGTPEFAVPSLEALSDAGYYPQTVVTGLDRGRGRGQSTRPTAVKKTAKALGIDDILQPASVHDASFAEALRERDPDCFVVVAFKILPPSVLSIPSKGAFNLHGSLLPAYRGAAPIHRAVMNGDPETGVTTFFLEPAVDTGDMILKKRMPIGPNDTTGAVHDRMMHLGAEAVVETVKLIEQGTAPRIPQDNEAATPAPKVHAEEADIPWAEPAPTVHNHIRGLSPIPGAWTLHGDTRLKVYRSRVLNAAAAQSALQSAKQPTPGMVLATDGVVHVSCGSGVVSLETLQQPGKQRLDAEAFVNGYPLSPGDVLASSATDSVVT
jgi:methionyl-tRNA formyltransferase